MDSKTRIAVTYLLDELICLKEDNFQADIQLIMIPVSASLVAQRVKILPSTQETLVQSLGWEDSPAEKKGYLPQYSCLENSMDRGGAWRATVHGVTKSWTRGSN